jgi:Arc/MetJ-type ribon-helix-helix transcriptional regulator
MVATELIGVKVEVEIKDRILKLVDSGKYLTVSAFMHRAIREQLLRDESGIDPVAKIPILEKISEEILRKSDELELRIRKLEKK